MFPLREVRGWVHHSLDGGASREMKPFDGRVQGGRWVRPNIWRLIEALKDTLPKPVAQVGALLG